MKTSLALMVTNPNTLGVFEQRIHKIADLMHAKGGLLYMDGANMNALVGRRVQAILAWTLMHLTCTKTFSTPHGGGGRDRGRWRSRKFWSRSYHAGRCY